MSPTLSRFPLPAGFGQRMHRRDALRIGSVTAASTLASIFAPGRVRANPEQARTGKPASAHSVILLWMAGGVTHHESFDPKPDAPEEIRGSLSTIPTRLPGVRFSAVCPELAKIADRLAIVRTYAPGSDDHFLAQAMALSGRKVTPAQITSEPNVGAVVSKLHGPRAGFPGYIAVPGVTRPGPPPKNLFVGGWLGAQYGPFPTGGSPKNADFTAKVQEASEEEFNRQALQLAEGLTDQRLSARESLRARLDAKLRGFEAAVSVNDHYTGAFKMLQSPKVRGALDLTQEPDAVRERYGRTKVGSRCLLARRLVEAGARFVMVDYGYDPEYGNLWDNHNAASQNFPHICEMAQRPYHVAGMDRAFAGLLNDLMERGLLDRTLVVFLTDFGRTPKINKNGGRDHWGKAGSIFFAGGGTQGGRVIGATDKIGAFPTTPAYTPWDVAATIYQAIGIPLDTALHDQQDRQLLLLPEGEPIPEVLG
ncbi:MAG: DUF1501 domain-containing protein [Bacteroidales bacterium]|nr:DUF1501 domain-containing protein [Bacteroidales bacterium]